MGKSEGKYLVVLCTVPVGKGEDLSNMIVENKLAACVNVIKGIKSVYWWKGNIERDEEELMIIKTKMERFEELLGFIKENHPYSVPEIIALPIIYGNEDYLRWMDESI